MIIPFNKPEKADRVCSFCKKKESTVKKMVQSSTEKCICNECIEKCTKLLKESDK